MVKKIYDLVEAFPTKERYCLCQQMRRSVVSIPSNIAEGKGRGTGKEVVRFTKIALGSMSELRSQLDIAISLGYGKPKSLINIKSLIIDLEKMTNSFISKVPIK